MLLNKKHALIPVALVLVATMLMTPMANAIPATYCYISTVETSQNVTNADRVKGSDYTTYASFAGGSTGSQFVGKLTVLPPSGAKGWAQAYSASSSTLNFYSASSATPATWTNVGSAIVTTSATVYTSSGGSSFQGNQQYIGIFNSGSTCYVDAAGAVW